MNQAAAVVICGIANERSLAAAVAQLLVDQGQALCLTWQDERHRPRVEALAQQWGAQCLGRLDVRDPESIAAAVAAVGSRRLTGLVHAIAFAQLRDDAGDAIPVHQVDAARWAEALEVSARSLPALLAAFTPQFEPGAGVVALTHHGARRVVPGYNLMGVAKAALEAALRYCAAELGPQGIRVNGVSAGPVRTAAASAVPGFRERLRTHAQEVPLRRNISHQEVAAAVAWLLSPAASAITGVILPVDAGEHLL